MFHGFHISLNTNLAQVRLVKLYKWSSPTLFWKELTWERLFPLCHFCFVSGLQWMNEWEGEWIGHTGFACQLVIWGTEDKDFKVGPSPLFGAASLPRSWLLMSLLPGIYVQPLLMPRCAWPGSISITSIPSDNMNKRWLVWPQKAPR